MASCSVTTSPVRNIYTSKIKYDETTMQSLADISQHCIDSTDKSSGNTGETCYIIPVNGASSCLDYYKVQELPDRIYVGHSHCRLNFINVKFSEFNCKGVKAGQHVHKKFAYKVIMTNQVLPARKVANTIEDLLTSDKDEFLGIIMAMPKERAAEIMKHLMVKRHGKPDEHFNCVVRALIEKWPKMCAHILLDIEKISEDKGINCGHCFLELIGGIKHIKLFSSCEIESDFTPTALHAMLKSERPHKRALIIQKFCEFSPDGIRLITETPEVAADVIKSLLKSLTQDKRQDTLKALKLVNGSLFDEISKCSAKLKKYNLDQVTVSDKERKAFLKEDYSSVSGRQAGDVTALSRNLVIPNEADEASPEDSSACFNGFSGQLTEVSPEEPTGNEEIELRTFTPTKKPAAAVTGASGFKSRGFPVKPNHAYKRLVLATFYQTPEWASDKTDDEIQAAYAELVSQGKFKPEVAVGKIKAVIENLLKAECKSSDPEEIEKQSWRNSLKGSPDEISQRIFDKYINKPDGYFDDQSESWLTDIFIAETEVFHKGEALIKAQVSAAMFRAPGMDFYPEPVEDKTDRPRKEKTASGGRNYQTGAATTPAASHNPAKSKPVQISGKGGDPKLAGDRQQLKSLTIQSVVYTELRESLWDDIRPFIPGKQLLIILARNVAEYLDDTEEVQAAIADAMAEAIARFNGKVPKRQALDNWAAHIDKTLRDTKLGGKKANTPRKPRALPTAAAASEGQVTGRGATSKMTRQTPAPVLPAAKPGAQAVKTPSQGGAARKVTKR